MEIYKESKEKHVKVTRKWEINKRQVRITNKQAEEWSTGQPNQQIIQVICTDGSWKEKPKKNEWQAAITWTLQDDNKITNHIVK